MANMSGNLWMLQNKGDEMEPGTKEKLMNVIERMCDYVREQLGSLASNALMSHLLRGESLD